MPIAWSRGTAEDDLSGEAEDSLTASGALSGGNSSNDEAMTAPGSESAGAPSAGEPAPHADASQRSYRKLVHGPGQSVT